MNCSDWEVEIAGEAESDALRDHMLQCARCREFALEITANREALRTLAVDPSAVILVRNRVMAGLIKAPPRQARIGWTWPAAVAACLAILCASLALMRFPSPAPPKPVVTLARPLIFPTVAEANPRPHTIRHRRASNVALAGKEPLVIKMLTDDPDVVIIWITDQKGDSL